MSRSIKGRKPPGWDYWGRRPIGVGANGTAEKRIGIKKERASLKRGLRNEKEADRGHPSGDQDD